jgi:sulfotransferase
MNQRKLSVRPQNTENKDKQIYFLCAMPRSGNTLFASIMNQNPDIAVTANSITLEIMKELFLLKKTDVFQNFPDEQSLDNVMDEVYNLYYNYWNYKVIIDRGPVCTPGNLKVMQKHFKQPIRCIVLVRGVVDVLASYIKWFETEPTSFLNKYKTIDEKLSVVMKKDGAVAKELMSIQYLLHYPDMAVFIKYDDLVQNPEQEIRKVYNFLKLPYFNHRFVDLDQITVNGIQYNDGIVGKNMHTIRTEKIMKVENEYKKLIPERFIKEYGHIRF